MQMTINKFEFDADQIITGPLNKKAMGTQIVQKLLEDCVFKNSKELQSKRVKSDLLEDKKTQLLRLTERDFRRGPKFQREDIEGIMKDLNFAKTYAYSDKYKKLKKY